MQWDARIGRRLKLRDLHIFLTVAQQGTMGKAATQLSVSQPVVSKAVTDMECLLKVRLFDRTAHGAEPTAYGRALLKWGVVIFDDLRQSVKEIEFLADPTAGELCIGSSEAMTTGLIPAVIDRLTRQYPRIALSVMQAPTTSQQYRDLRERSVDLILGRIVPSSAGEDLEVEILFEDPLFVAVGITNKWRQRRKIELAELMNEPWVLPALNTFTGPVVKEAFRVKGLDLPRQAVMTASIQLCIALLATGRFLTVFPASILRLSAKRLSVKALPVDLSIRPGQVGVVTLKNRTISPVAQLFIECAREVIKPLVRAK